MFLFTLLIFIAGFMKTEEKVVLDEWYQWLRDEKMANVDLIVYLRVSPEVLAKRIKSRGRKEEKNVSLDTLRTLHNFHEDWLIKKVHPVPAPVLIIDGEQSLENMVAEYKKCNDEIQKVFLSDTC